MAGASIFPSLPNNEFPLLSLAANALQAFKERLAKRQGFHHRCGGLQHRADARAPAAVRHRGDHATALFTVGFLRENALRNALSGRIVGLDPSGLYRTPPD